MKENKTILAINAIVNKDNMVDVQSYLENIGALFAKNGGKPIARYKTVQDIIGNESPEIIGLFEFPSADAINQMIDGEDFIALAELRAKAFTKLNLVICNEM
jgi:uncharacterized protein (DUF1330 family)